MLRYVPGTRRDDVGDRGMNLSKEDIRAKIRKAGLRGHSWNPSETKKRMGSIVDDFTVESKQYKLTIDFFGNAETRAENIEKFNIMTDMDIQNLTPGRLYFHDQYIECYITESEYNVIDGRQGIRNTAKVFAPYPFWIKEKTIPFIADADEEQQEKSASVKTYPYEYSYEYEVDLLMRKVFNEHFTDADFELTIYGPAITPTIIIGGHVYQLNCDLQEGEYIKINSDNKTAYKVYEDGIKESVYNYRNRSYYIYEPIPSGMQTVSWDGSFGFDLKLIMKRSEPSWI